MKLSHQLQHGTRLAVIAATSVLVMSQAQAKSDSAFMKDAAHAGSAEIEASKLAQTKAQRTDVKAFADTMFTDHSKVAEELQALAGSKKVTLPDGPSVSQKAQLKMIEVGDDAKFDVRYVKTFGVKAHEDTAQLFQTAAREDEGSRSQGLRTEDPARLATSPGHGKDACRRGCRQEVTTHRGA